MRMEGKDSEREEGLTFYKRMYVARVHGEEDMQLMVTVDCVASW